MGASFDHPPLRLPENELAWTALERLLAFEVEEVPSLLFVHGPSGVGKSHLVVHELRQLLELTDTLQYRLLSMHEFATLCMESTESSAAEEAIRNLAKLDLLICEGLQHLDRQAWIQKKLIPLFDQLQRGGGRILITSQIPIGAYEQLLPRLASRCRGGVTSSIGLPAESSRQRLLRYFAHLHELPLDDDMVTRLARQLPVSPRELQGTIVQLEAWRRHAGNELTPRSIDEYLALQQQREAPSMTQIARSVAREFGVSVQSIRSAAREKSLLIPRQMAMLLARELSQAHYAEIGAYFGGRSHSTVMHACRALAKKSRECPELDYRLGQLRRQLQCPGSQ